MSHAPTTLVDGVRALVLGLGRFTGGVETVRFLSARGADVLVSDTAPRESLGASAAAVEAMGARVHFGPQTPDLLRDVHLVVASPAIAFDHEVLRAAAERKIPVTTEMNLFLERVRAPVLGITGTKGKSTTTTIVARMLEATGRVVHVGGNVGHSLLASVDAIGAEDLVVLELSSFQLWWVHHVKRSAHVALVTNLFGDHLDRHGTLGAYAAAKRALIEYQGPADVAVLPHGDRDVERAGFATAGHGRRVWYGPGGDVFLDGGTVRTRDGRQIDVSDFGLWGEHNRQNLLAASAAALQVPGVGDEHVSAGARSARPLPHRLAPVAEVDGVLYVDDSNATNPTSTACALEATPRPAVVLVGGKSKGLPLDPLVEALVRHARAVVGIGTTGPEVIARIGDRLPAVNGGEDLETAVRRAAALARPGDAVLLSPSFASFDQYPSFVARGLAFQEAVRKLAGEAEARRTLGV